MKIVVLGGGASGRLVAHALRSRPDVEVTVLEASRKGEYKLTRDSGCNFLWYPIEGVSCVPCTIRTTIDEDPPSAATIAKYKLKVGKADDLYFLRDLMNTQFAQVRGGFNVHEWPCADAITYGARIQFVDLGEQKVIVQFDAHSHSTYPYDHVVSTIPLPVLVKVLGSKQSLFVEGSTHHPIYVVNRIAHIPAPDGEIWVNYNSGHSCDWYRSTVRGEDEQLEYIYEPRGKQYRKLFPGKIRDTEGVHEAWRIATAAKVVCFGRFASWLPDELLHETYRRIQTWVSQLEE